MHTAKMGLLFAESDTTLSKELCVHLAGMQRRGLIELIGAPSSKTRLEQEDIPELTILLLLISSAFIADEFLVQMALYAEHRKGLCVIPVVLKDVDWAQDLPKIGAKQPLPRNGKSVARQDHDVAFSAITQEIRGLL